MTELLAGLLGVLVGLLFGNRLALGRDKRKEFNERARPIHHVIHKALGNIEKRTNWSLWDKEQLHDLSLQMNKRDRLHLQLLADRCEAVNKESYKLNGYGAYEAHEDRIPDLENALNELKSFIVFK